MSCIPDQVKQERLAKFMAACGVASRRKCEAIIACGRVFVNDKKITDPAINILPEYDKIVFDGQRLKKSDPVYLLLYKPRGYTCSSYDRHASRLAIDLLPNEFGRLFTVGRLDRESEGLIICTNDGEFAQRVAHPRHEILKTYHVLIDARPAPRAIARIVDGIEEKGEFLQATKVTMLRGVSKDEPKGFWLEFILNEGKKREIRRLCSAVGWRVLRLKRVAIGAISSPALSAGQWRFLTDDELSF